MTTWRLRNACWITNATNTHSQYVILITFPLQKWFHERASLLRSTYIAHHLHILFSRSVQAAGCCSLSNNLPAVHRCPPRRCCTNLPFALYLQTQFTPNANLRVVSPHSHRLAPRHCNIRLLTVLTQYLYWQKVSGSTVNTYEHTWN